jgi:hypothetical protein
MEMNGVLIFWLYVDIVILPHATVRNVSQPSLTAAIKSWKMKWNVVPARPCGCHLTRPLGKFYIKSGSSTESRTQRQTCRHAGTHDPVYVKTGLLGARRAIRHCCRFPCRPIRTSIA